MGNWVPGGCGKPSHNSMLLRRSSRVEVHVEKMSLKMYSNYLSAHNFILQQTVFDYKIVYTCGESISFGLRVKNPKSIADPILKYKYYISAMNFGKTDAKRTAQTAARHSKIIFSVPPHDDF